MIVTTTTTTTTATVVITTGGGTSREGPKPCKFPFTYKGVDYVECTGVDAAFGRLWCATAAEYSKDEWRFCSYV